MITGSKQSRISLQIHEKPQFLSFRNQFWQQTDLQTNVHRAQVKRCRPFKIKILTNFAEKMKQL